MTEELEEQEDPGGSPRQDAPGVAVIDEAPVAVDVEQLRAATTRALTVLGIQPEASLAITLVDETRMAELKHEALGVHAATDVLTFPVDDPADPAPGPVMLGDIVLCPAVADRQARALGYGLAEELPHLVVHGLLHMTGHTHETPDGERAMAAEEQRVLRAIR